MINLLRLSELQYVYIFFYKKKKLIVFGNAQIVLICEASHGTEEFYYERYLTHND